ncbi:Haloacetate dehalogenase H-1 [Aquimixticola soesokkakensis]|uniref:Haloacetate dehalogenase H-1 n=1 Tax=Aquimixticola soesokkakensis TaxID=1519096 RepID=A0A1Y5TDT9_9RHOB|nr:alpha/beta hydrolase [Aquimixticola soesokkakensis]SLN59669.1 Haloacetate dehalogenase H-1 [Aquimixticola soesokkakensis]
MPHFTSSDGLGLAYHVQGSGPPVLCLAGLTRNMADFDDVAQQFQDRAQILRLDTRGRGGSGFASDPMTYTVPYEARDALELLDHLGLEQAAILGTSRGGLIAMVIAATAKERLSGVMLNDIGPVIDPVGLEPILDYLGKRPAYRSYEEAAQNLPAAMPGFANVTPAQWLTHAKRVFGPVPQGQERLSLRYDPRLRDAVAASSAIPAPDLWPLFDAFGGLPLGVIRGANSDLLSRATLSEMIRRRPDMIVAEVPDRAHVPFLDEPAAVAALSAWIEALT